MADGKVKVAVAKTDDRAAGVAAVIDALGVNPVQGKPVLIKPNFNTADPPPASTDNASLMALVDKLRAMGAASLSVGERSYPVTARVMADKGIDTLLTEAGVEVIDFDQLPAADWVAFDLTGSHWPEGLRIARPIMEAESLVEMCCLKTHGSGGHITMSLKLAVGVMPCARLGFDHMNQLHASSHQREMITEINAAFSPDLVIMDGVDAFVDGGPSSGNHARAEMMFASTDRVALDAAGVAALKMLGSNPTIMDRPVFDQDQLVRAVELGLGVSGPEQIELVPADEASRRTVDRLAAVLAGG